MGGYLLWQIYNYSNEMLEFQRLEFILSSLQQSDCE